MRSAKAFLALLAFAGQAALAQPPLGAQGPEGEPNREQQCRVPTPDADISARAVLFRPPGDGPFRIALIAHATTQNALRRAQMSQPEYRALAAFLVARGFAVLVPERLGHGATGGKYLEDQGGCDDPDYTHAARATAEQIALPLQFLRGQPFIRKAGMIQVEFPKVGQQRGLGKRAIRDIGARQVQHLKVTEACKLLNAAIGDIGEVQLEAFEAWHFADLGQDFVIHPAPR